MSYSSYSLSLLGGGALAALVVGKLLLSEKYPQTWFLVLRHSAAFWRYVAYYGCLAAVATALVLHMPFGRRSPIEAIHPSIFWPFAIGFVGPLAISTLFGADQINRLIRFALVLFEPRLLEVIVRNEYFALKREIRPFASLWPDIHVVKATIKRNHPTCSKTRTGSCSARSWRRRPRSTSR